MRKLKYRDFDNVETVLCECGKKAQWFIYFDDKRWGWACLQCRANYYNVNSQFIRGQSSCQQ